MNEHALEAQQTLVENALPLVFDTYDQAVADGVVAPVVVLVDCEDELGGEIARGWLGDATVDEAISLHAAEHQETDDTPNETDTVAFARAIAWQACREELSEAFPYLAGVFSGSPPADGVLVLGITAGGASALTAPFSAR